MARKLNFIFISSLHLFLMFSYYITPTIDSRVFYYVYNKAGIDVYHDFFYLYKPVLRKAKYFL